MNISDLNYLEVVNTETGKALAGGGDIAFKIESDVDIDKKVNLDINKFVKSDVDNKGNLATAQSDAEAFGKNVLAEVETYTFVTEKEAFAYSQSVSSYDPGKGY